jgi:hypothetical protein
LLVFSTQSFFECEIRLSPSPFLTDVLADNFNGVQQYRSHAIATIFFAALPLMRPEIFAPQV